MPKTLKNRRKKPRLPATHSKPEPAAPSPQKVVSRKPTLLRVSGLAARPADFPVGSVQSRAAARAMSSYRLESEPLRTVLALIKRDPFTPALVVPSAPDHGDGCGCDRCRLLFKDDSQQQKPRAPSVDANREVPVEPYNEAQRRENYLRALRDVSRVGTADVAPLPAWAR